MDYFQLLDLKKEPFSNSPDPEFFYGSRQHLGCLQKLELSVRLRRGLNVITADVGMGKTTLCRQLIRRFSADKDVRTHLLLDPACSSAHEFLCIIAQMFNLPVDPDKDTERRLKEKIKGYLFEQGVEKDKVIALIIDEGQKLPYHCTEVLREFLNYETNSNKLLQIIIFAQTEFDQILQEHPNFADRVSLYHKLSPLSYKETKALVQFRLREAAEGVVPAIFSESGFWAVYQSTGGYPRKIVELGYRVLLALIVQSRRKANWRLVRSCAKRGTPIKRQERTLRPVFTGLLIAAIALGLSVASKEDVASLWKRFSPQSNVELMSAAPAAVKPPAVKPPAVKQAAAPPAAPAVSAVASSAPETPEQPAQEAPGPADAASIAEEEPLIAESQLEEPPRAQPLYAAVKEPVEAPAAAKPEPAVFPAGLVSMWGGRFTDYSQIIFWFDKEVAFEGPALHSREAEFRFFNAVSKVASYREYSSFPGWVMLKKRDGDVQARIGLPANLEGIEHFVEHDPFRIIVNLYHYQQPRVEDKS
ncbi:Putative Type II secretory pathway component ExeA (predicted ATPase)-like protein [Desulfatibacillum aliphaticivorans]|uniref:Type II secretory pathway component ExeA (Predicted ATPase)-like protein n=1 Tax=Desulfatibacillum aliphaticivorans TaxID=218208 RepID=B8FD62_DESAL|nr:AAA family ATPase [Desulfatibacillum aliphaticivorans]ACL06493.1 Putative Type II secretory pathway component ExeA (predicted ATPase)-like protein [Desulfatibacillum aliphaticivorans]